MSYKPLSDILSSSMITELDLNPEFVALSAGQKISVINSAMQVIAEYYNAKGKTDYLANPEMSSKPCAGVAFDTYESSYDPGNLHTIVDSRFSWESLHYDSAGETVQLAWIFNPAGGSSSVTFHSSDESIATVDANGVVTKIKAYSWLESDPVTITVTTNDGGFTDTVIIDQSYPT